MSVASWSAYSFHALGSSCRIVAPDEELARDAARRVRELDRTWSRFRPDSEVSALNASAGRLTIVSDVTFDLIAHAQRARMATGGLFNPLMLDQLVDLGYDRSWARMCDRRSDRAEEGGRSATDPEALRPAADEDIELYPEISAVRIPGGSRFDPGGIGKGLAADMVAAALVDAGAPSAQIELGGDVRLVGPSWTGGDWEVVVDDADHGVERAATIALSEGAVATSSVVRRRWCRNGVQVHHLLDPATGCSAHTDLDAVTTVGPSLWWSEVVAKVALVAGSRRAVAMLGDFDMSALLVRADEPSRYHVVGRPLVAR